MNVPKAGFFFTAKEVVGVEGGFVACAKKSLVGWKSRRSRGLLYALFLTIVLIITTSSHNIPHYPRRPHYVLSFSHPLFFLYTHDASHSDTSASELCTWLVQSATSSVQIQHAYDQTHHSADASSTFKVGLTRRPHKYSTQNLIVR